MSDLFVSIGAGPGMGLSTAERFAREGFDLVLTSRDLTRLQSSAEQLRKNTGRRVETVALDASSVDGVQRLAETYGAKTGVLHYNAAAMQKTDLLDSSPETMKQNLSVDILGALAAVKYFAPFMEKKQKGTILLTGGGLALTPNAEYLSLSIGKAGIRCMTEALFPQLSAKGIHLATLTVAAYVNAGSQEAAAVADAFWKLHTEAAGAWTWEAMFR